MVNKPELIVVDKNDKPVGFADVGESHRGRGRHHRAFVTVLFDNKRRIILQRRKHRLFNGLWDLSAISHPLKIGRKTETYQQASDRALKKEMGISHVAVIKVGAFNYFARDGKNCENEYCAILKGEYSGRIVPNEGEVYGFMKMDFEDFISDIVKNPKKYTPWAKLAAEEILKSSPYFVETGSTSKGRQTFQKELERFRRQFSKYQDRFFKQRTQEAGKYPSLITKFYSDLAVFSSGGKKLRPFLVYLGWKLAGKKEIVKILPIALAFELVHSFLVIHDDVIDRSELRRGRPTIHKQYERKFGYHYGISQAIILGDIACFEAFKLIAESNFSDSIKRDLVHEFSLVLLETGYGEALDVEYSHISAKFKDIETVTNLKTARYSFVGPLVLGSVAAGKKKTSLKTLVEFGLLLGSAYQLTDDILGTFGSEREIGKSLLSDLREGKNTLLVHRARELASKKDRKILDAVWGSHDSVLADLKRVRKIIEASGALVWAQKENEKVIEKAKLLINDLSKDMQVQNILGEFADFVAARKN